MSWIRVVMDACCIHPKDPVENAYLSIAALSFSKPAFYVEPESLRELFFIPFKMVGCSKGGKIVAVNDDTGAALWVVKTTWAGEAPDESHVM